MPWSTDDFHVAANNSRCAWSLSAGTRILLLAPTPGRLYLAGKSEYRDTCPCRKSTPKVLVMQSAEVRCCDASTDGPNFPGNRRVLVQRQMGTGLVVICHVRAKYVPKVTLAQHNDMIEYLSPDRANQPFSIGVLPWRSWCSWSVANAHCV